ncbi:hypothetical protein [Labrys wisconsinensis]|uniref:Uncharacterized protein n=1 Tax=Labrys wisconsinensis TaxID=425677 RepID=A0ABU0J547_9HYPH|nr:hypothetical protein [Labrys wisconsinensis]MDQ0469390.1 hypothetical protein [Labrys wisconsinensis]
MSSDTQPETRVVPRPVERLPDYAHAKSRQALSAKLVEAFNMSAASADAVANAVVDPSEVRKLIGDPADPGAEHIAVPGGTLQGFRTQVWARRVMPDPRNPRTLPSRRHPFAVDPGTGAEASRFRPVAEPHSPEEGHPNAAELVVDVESRDHLDWASQQAATFILTNNDWRESIQSQGVMEAVYLVATTYRHANGDPDATALTSIDGSSRLTASHSNLEVRSSDVPYDDADSKLRNYIRRLNEMFAKGPEESDLIALRGERVPALVIVGFVPHEGGSTCFPTAVRSLVALKHVDPPTPWGEGPENEALADEVLDELYRRGLISATERDYYAGACTKAEARSAHLSDDPAVRSASIVALLTKQDERYRNAIRIAVTSQSTRKRIGPKLLNSLATALVLRAVDEPSTADLDQVRRYLRHAFGKSVHQRPWEGTNRDTETLAATAMMEVRQAIASGTLDDPGPASLELAVRAAYPLIVSGRLSGDRGTANNEQPDRRRPGEVLEVLRQTPQGIHQLAQALRDFAAGENIRAVDEEGVVLSLSGGEGERTVSDIYLRGEFPPLGKARARRPGQSVTDRYHNAVNVLAGAMDELSRAFEALKVVDGDDGRPIVEVNGVDHRACATWRELIGSIDDELVFWSKIHQRTKGVSTRRRDEGEDESSAEAESDLASEWDRADDAEAV